MMLDCSFKVTFGLINESVVRENSLKIRITFKTEETV